MQAVPLLVGTTKDEWRAFDTVLDVNVSGTFLGAREAADCSVALRVRDGGQVGPIPVDEALAHLVSASRIP